MFKDLLVTRSSRVSHRRTGQDRIADGHSALVMATPAFEGVFRRFTMNRVVTAAEGVDAPGLYARDPDALVVVEHVCVSHEAFATASRDPEYLSRVKADEEYIGREILTGPPVAYDVRERTVFDSGDAGALRVFDFLARRETVPVEAFLTAMRAEGERTAADPAHRAVVRRQVHDRVTGDRPSLYAHDGTGHDLVVESWVTGFADLEPLHRTLRARYADLVDPDRSFSAFTLQQTIV
ncbi:EthD domain-containing protein [Streptomyces sp. NPDC091281]|uniref:EthD domain-containing protein n=1 Tax=Streptomyces sp. NPDC091281 TaxID=3365985 RepID=UPI00381AAD7A